MNAPLVRKTALDLALERGLIVVDPALSSSEDLRAYARRGELDLETMQALEREAELLVTGRYPEYGDQPTALAPGGPALVQPHQLGLYP